MVKDTYKLVLSLIDTDCFLRLSVDSAVLNIGLRRCLVDISLFIMALVHRTYANCDRIEIRDVRDLHAMDLEKQDNYADIIISNTARGRKLNDMSPGFDTFVSSGNLSDMSLNVQFITLYSDNVSNQSLDDKYCRR
ncbi:hypothetical protein J6590_062393 [Homalodisca vitripennis]|nr:hypothetical protein J6590_062393 [Homalodisca vitripennis]